MKTYLTEGEGKMYLSGFHTGFNWPDKWESHGRPGGPPAYDRQTRDENSAWLDGWNAGHTRKIETGRSNTVIPIPEFVPSLNLKDDVQNFFRTPLRKEKERRETK